MSCLFFSLLCYVTRVRVVCVCVYVCSHAHASSKRVFVHISNVCIVHMQQHTYRYTHRCIRIHIYNVFFSCRFYKYKTHEVAEGYVPFILFFLAFLLLQRVTSLFLRRVYVRSSSLFLFSSFFIFFLIEISRPPSQKRKKRKNRTSLGYDR